MGTTRLLCAAVDPVLLAMKARRDVCGSDQVARRITTCLQVRMDPALHLWIAQHFESHANESLLTFGQIPKGDSMSAWLRPAL